MPYSRAEMVETVVLCFIRSGVTSGRFGSLEVGPEGAYRVTLIDEGEFIVGLTTGGWSVTYDGVEGIAPQLLDAAHLAINL
jgi:hypothetical protein